MLWDIFFSLFFELFGSFIPHSPKKVKTDCFAVFFNLLFSSARWDYSLKNSSTGRWLREITHTQSASLPSLYFFFGGYYMFWWNFVYNLNDVCSKRIISWIVVRFSVYALKHLISFLLDAGNPFNIMNEHI